MIEHIVLFRLMDGVTSADVDELFASLHAIARAVDGVVDYRLERDAGLRDAGNEDIALVARFRDEEDFQADLTHPDHLAVLENSAPRVFTWSPVAGVPDRTVMSMPVPFRKNSFVKNRNSRSSRQHPGTKRAHLMRSRITVRFRTTAPPRLA